MDGTGIDIGVISNGIEHLNTAQMSGDLPGTVYSQGPGRGDEGTAMLELIYDIAPGADLYFAPASNATSMSSAITWLRNQGADVIVDDLSFLAEPYFTDGTVATAVSNAVNAGVTYVTAAGNYAQSHYQGAIGALDANNDKVWPAGGNVLPVLFPGSASDTTSLSMAVEWSDQWGNSSNDYDAYALAWTGSNWVEWSSLPGHEGEGRSEGTQGGVGYNPLEGMVLTNDFGYDITIGFMVHRYSGATNRELEVYVYGGQFYADAFAANIVSGDSIFGQGAVETAITVGAIDAAEPGNDAMESFSSQGPSRIYTNFATQTFTSRNSLDVAGIDGVETSIGSQGYFNEIFYGTSAAAPGVAAVAALFKAANPSLTPAQVQAMLKASAADIGTAGYDNVSGYGRVDAEAAITDAPTGVDLVAGSDTGKYSNDNLTKLDNSSSGSELQFDVLGTVNGATVKLFADGHLVGSAVASGTTTRITSTGSYDLVDGQHNLTATQTQTDNLESVPSSGLAMTVDTVGPTMTALLNDGTGFVSQIDWMNFTFSEAVNSDTCSLSLSRYVDSAWQSYSTSGAVFTYDAPNNTAQYDMYTYDSTNGSRVVISNDAWYVAVVSAEDLAGNSVATNSTEFYRMQGDFTGDHAVSFADYLLLEQNFGKYGDWMAGDCNLNGAVSFADYLLLEQNFGKSLTDQPVWA